MEYGASPEQPKSSSRGGEVLNPSSFYNGEIEARTLALEVERFCPRSKRAEEKEEVISHANLLLLGASG